VLTAVIAAMLGLALLAVAHFTSWPTPESPPRQGEALDPKELAVGRVIHSHAALSRTVREPFNTWTNLAFVAAGSILLFRRRPSVLAHAGLALIAVGIGSFLYHASSSRTLRHLDVGAMYWIYALLLVLGLGAVSRSFAACYQRFSRAWFVLIPCLAAIVTVYRNVRLAGWKPFDLSLVTGVAAAVAGVSMVVVALRTGRWTQTCVSLFLFGVSVFLQIGDRPGAWLCDPESIIQAHGMWHVLGAIACGIACIQLAHAWENAPNKSLQPTATAVTPPAGQEARQP
jgi:hypothetical protein